MVRDDLVLRSVVNANVFVFSRRDVKTSEAVDAPALIGALHYQQRALEIEAASLRRLRTGHGSLCSPCSPLSYSPPGALPRKQVHEEVPPPIRIALAQLLRIELAKEL